MAKGTEAPVAWMVLEANGRREGIQSREGAREGEARRHLDNAS